MLPRRNRVQRANDLAQGTNAYIRGELGDPVLEKLLGELEDYVELQGLGGDYYHLEAAKRKSDKAAGKVFLVKSNPRNRGESQNSLTHKAIKATHDLHANGGVPLVNAPSKEPAIARVNELLDQYVMDTSIRDIGSAGERGELPRSNAELRDVAASLLVDTDRGYNSRAGYAYGGMPLDGGHIIGYASRPDLANKGSNLEWENQYANKGKSATERMAKGFDREATDAELAQGLFRSHLNKLVEDVVLPGRKGSKTREEFMAPINAKAGSTRVDSPGDNADRVAIIDSDGGDVNLHVKPDGKGRARISQIG